MTIPSLAEAQQYMKDREWVAVTRDAGTLVRVPQPAARQPNPHTTWTVAALNRLKEITVQSDRLVVLRPDAGNPVAARHDPTFFRYVKHTNGFMVQMKLDAFSEGIVEAHCLHRPVLAACGRNARWRLKNVAKVVIVGRDLFPDTRVVFDRL